MIALILFSIICFIIIWFVIFKVTLTVQKRNLFKNIPEKLEKQDKRFFNNGKEVNIKELLGKEEVVEEVSEEPKPEPEEIEPKNNVVKEQIETVKKTVNHVQKLPTFDNEFKLPGKEE